MLLLLLLGHFSPVWLCATPWTAAHRALLSTEFSRQEYWSGLPFPSQLLESVQFSHWVMSDSLRPMNRSMPGLPVYHQLPEITQNSCPLSWWCHPAISSSVIPFSSCPQSLPASGSFPMSQLFAWGDQSIGVSASASVLPMNTQDWSPLGWTGWISLQPKGLPRIFNTTVQKHQCFGISFLHSPTLTSIHDHWKNHSLD